MIIFDLDGTLSDCEHRRHFVDPLKCHPDYYRKPCQSCNNGSTHDIDPQFHKITHQLWKRDWKSFYEACEKDKPINQSLIIMHYLKEIIGERVQIWSERCESVRAKTNTWLLMNGITDINLIKNLKMRPEGLDCPQERLFEYFLFQSQAEEKKPMKEGEWISLYNGNFKHIEMAFLSHKPTINLFRSHGIFVFDCRQNENN